MSLHIILGLSSQKPDSEVSVVYAGRSGQAAREAMLKSASPRFLILNNPLGIPKNNPHAAANAAAQAAKRSVRR
jgi:hypothetical protein